MRCMTRREHHIYCEFSFELNVAIPHMYYLQQNGEDIKTRSFPGNACYYFWSDNHESDLADEPFTNLDDYYFPIVGIGDRQEYYGYDLEMKNASFPDMKSHFLKMAVDEGLKERFSDKPLIVINNKSITEWGIGVYNRIEKEEISYVYDRCKESHTIVYIRPENSMEDRGFVPDHQGNVGFDEKSHIRENCPEIVMIEDVMEDKPDLGFNEVQCMIHSLSDLHMSVLGGNAVIASYFGGKNIMVGRNEHNGHKGIWQNGSHLRKISGAEIVRVQNINADGSFRREVEAIENG